MKQKSGDCKQMKRNLYFCVYDLRDNELCVGSFDNKEDLCKMLGIKIQYLSRIMQRDGVYKSRYKIVIK